MVRGSSCHQCFGDAKDHLLIMHKYCRGNWAECPWAEMLMEKKYEEEKRP
jgi:hypothetical protein